MAEKEKKDKEKKEDRAESVKVVVRCRPLFPRETAANEYSIVNVDPKRNEISVNKPKEEASESEQPKSFTFDRVYAPDARQRTIFEETARPIVDSVVNGYNGTIFAYGQTGTGKTHTMEGNPDSEEDRGIMPNTFIHIFEAVKMAPQNMQYLVRASFLEIYMDDVYDLLNKETRAKLDVKENADKGVFVKGLSAYTVKSSDDLLKVLKKGTKARKVGATNMNPGSSRSHSILTITIETSETDSKGGVHYRAGKLNLVDLAGSERQKRTGAEGDRLDEAKAINLSLSALGNVIKALVTPGTKHVPFRDSKLTRLLQDSLGGNTKTCMIANLGPSNLSFEESVSTLRYADRAKQIKNAPRINEDPKDAMLRTFQDEIAKLKAQLDLRKKGMGLGLAAGGAGGPLDAAQLAQLAAAGLVSLGEDGQPQIIEHWSTKTVVEDTGITEQDVEQLKQKTQLDEQALVGKTEEERKKILADKAAAEETLRLAEERLRLKQEQEDRMRAEVENAERQLKEKEQQLLSGGQALDKAAKQKAELLRHEEELRVQHEEEERLRKEVEAAKEAEMLLNEHYNTTAEELQKKTAKLKLLWDKYQEKKGALSDLTGEWEAERADLYDTLRQLDRTVKLKSLVLANFVPPHYVDLIEKTAVWSAQNDEWALPGLEYAGNNVQRAVSGYGGVGGGVGGPAFMQDGYGAEHEGDELLLGADGLPLHGGLGLGLHGAAGGAPKKDVFYSYGMVAAAQQQQQQQTAGAARKR